MKYKLIVAMSFFGFSIVLFVFLGTMNNEQLTPEVEHRSEMSKPITFNSEQEIELNGKQFESVMSAESVNDEKEAEHSESFTHRFEKETEEFISSPSFDSIGKLNSTFLSESNAVNQQPLEIIFRSPNFVKIVESLSEIPGNQESAERQQKLYSQVIEQLGNDFHSETYACKGKICLIEFTYNESVNSDVLSKIRDFDTNYVFSSEETIGNGESIYKGVFIATADASSISIAR